METNDIAGKYELLVIGGSAGSLKVLMEFLPSLDAGLKMAIIVVLHRSNVRDTLLNELLAAKTKLAVKEAEEKEEISAGFIYVAPPDFHLLIEKDRTLSLDSSEKVNFSRPSIDVTFESAACVFGGRLACLLLSGANTDGVDGLLAAKRNGGLALVQTPSSADVPVMPQGAVLANAVDILLLPGQMAATINKLAV